MDWNIVCSWLSRVEWKIQSPQMWVDEYSSCFLNIYRYKYQTSTSTSTSTSRGSNRDVTIWHINICSQVSHYLEAFTTTHAPPCLWCLPFPLLADVCYYLLFFIFIQVTGRNFSLCVGWKSNCIDYQVQLVQIFSTNVDGQERATHPAFGKRSWTKFCLFIRSTLLIL